MRIRAITQIAGKDTISAELGHLLREEKYTRMRYLMAYVRWSGLHLIDDELQRFAQRGKLEGIVSIDFGGTTVEALTYLSELPNSKVWIFESGDLSIGFHPKVFLFDGDGSTGWDAIVGSANGSSGGLFDNVEICAVVTGTRRESNPFESVWEQFAKPLHPVGRDNLIRVDSGVLEELAPILDPYTKAPPDRPKHVRFRSPPPVERSASPPTAGRPPIPAKPKRRGRSSPPTRTSARPVVAGAGTLYVELWNETGGGTQVQFPKETITTYFGSDLKSITWLTLETPRGTARARIQTFPNNTFRIPLRFTSSLTRKAVLKFDRIQQDHYRVQAVTQSHRWYARWLARCTRQTRTGSKRFGIY